MAGTTKRAYPFGRLLGEFLFIVIGVLVAFQFESWQASREASERETEQLAALRSDFETNRGRFAQVMRNQRRVVGAGVELLGIIDGSRPAVSPDSVSILFSWSMAWYVAEPVTGAYDALISSGDITLVQDVGLRRRLASYFGSVVPGFEDHANSMDLLSLMQSESSGVMLPLMGPGGRESLQLSQPDRSQAAAVLLENDKFAGLLAWRTLMERNRLRFQSTSAAQVDTILSALDQQLARR